MENQRVFVLDLKCPTVKHGTGKQEADRQLYAQHSFEERYQGFLSGWSKSSVVQVLTSYCTDPSPPMLKAVMGSANQLSTLPEVLLVSANGTTGWTWTAEPISPCWLPIMSSQNTMSVHIKISVANSSSWTHAVVFLTPAELASLEVGPKLESQLWESLFQHGNEKH